MYMYRHREPNRIFFDCLSAARPLLRNGNGHDDSRAHESFPCLWFIIMLIMLIMLSDILPPVKPAIGVNLRQTHREPAL